MKINNIFLSSILCSILIVTVLLNMSGVVHTASEGETGTTTISPPKTKEEKISLESEQIKDEPNGIKSNCPLPREILEDEAWAPSAGDYYESLTFGKFGDTITKSVDFWVYNDDRSLLIMLELSDLDTTISPADSITFYFDVPDYDDHYPDEELSSGFLCTWEDAKYCERGDGSIRWVDYDEHWDYDDWYSDNSGVKGGTEDGWHHFDVTDDYLWALFPIGNAGLDGSKGDVFDINIRSGDVLGLWIDYYDDDAYEWWEYPAYDMDGGGYDDLRYNPEHWATLWTECIWGANIPHVHDDSSWVTFLGVQNLGHRESTIWFDFYDNDGNWLGGYTYTNVQPMAKVSGFAKTIAGMPSIVGQVYITSDSQFKYQCQIRDVGKDIWVNFAGEGVP